MNWVILGILVIGVLLTLAFLYGIGEQIEGAGQVLIEIRELLKQQCRSVREIENKLDQLE